MIWAYVVAGLTCCLGAAIAVVFYGARSQRETGPNGYAIPAVDDGTEIDRRLKAEIRQHEGKSGLRIVSDDLEAFRFRFDLARAAGRGLDLQYYCWKSDVTGKRKNCGMTIIYCDKDATTNLKVGAVRDSQITGLV